jgi:hypothetical protein
MSAVGQTCVEGSLRFCLMLALARGATGAMTEPAVSRILICIRRYFLCDIIGSSYPLGLGSSVAGGIRLHACSLPSAPSTKIQEHRCQESLHFLSLVLVYPVSILEDTVYLRNASKFCEMHRNYPIISAAADRALASLHSTFLS